LLKQRTEQDPPLCPWLMPVSGKFPRYPCDLSSITYCYRFAEKVLRAVKGEKGIIEPTFVYLPGISEGNAIAKETGLDFFSVPVELGVCSPYLVTSWLTDIN